MVNGWEGNQNFEFHDLIHTQYILEKFLMAQRIQYFDRKSKLIGIHFRLLTVFEIFSLLYKWLTL